MTVEQMIKETTYVCVYCDKDLDVDLSYCPSCREYKGIMTVADWEEYTGQSWD